ncbi:MAG: MarR family transcriptional regulator, partial [Bacteroidota bacterium]
IETKLAPREKSILVFINETPGCKSGEIASKLNIPNPTVKRILTELVKMNFSNESPRSKLTGYHSLKAELGNYFSDASVGEFFRLKL